VPEQKPTAAVGPGRVLALGYGFFALAAGARAGVQLATDASAAPLAYSLSAVAALVYLAGTVVVALADRLPRHSHRAVVLCSVELAGVLVVGVLSLAVPRWFPEPSVWSAFGQGYAFVPAVLPVLALMWLFLRGRSLTGPTTVVAMTSVGVIGLGIMGAGMARNIARAGHELVVWNRTASRAQPFVDAGAKLAASPAELAARVDVVLVCVSDTPDVEQVLLGSDGVSSGGRAGLVVVDASTISPVATRRFAEQLAAQGIRLLDAPVSGGSEGADKGTLAVMVGGDAADLAIARPVLEAIGSTVTHLGAVGSGQTCKLVNQVLVVVNMLAVSEAMLLAQAGGLDLTTTIAAVQGGAAGSWMLSNRGPQVAARDWRPGFTIDLQQKDLRLVLELADELGVPAIATAQVSQLYRAVQAAGGGGDGNHALVKALEALSGVTVGGTS
jgi:3-hydroxyisobutyrate dehydrogenase-like beta-hydroxyacid dehydrogenase